MSDLRDLYQEVILDHSKRPRNFGALAGATGRAEGFNPLCGDHLTVYVRQDGDTIAAVRFEGAGCAISSASASMMTAALQGRTVAEADALFARFHAMVTAASDAPRLDAATDGATDAAALGKLTVFAGVREFPMRVKCASLAWHAVQAALHGDAARVTTE